MRAIGAPICLVWMVWVIGILPVSAQERPENKVDWNARVTASRVDKENIPTFELRDTRTTVRLEREAAKTKLFARVKGRVVAQEWNLLFKREWVVKAQNRDRDFEVEVLLTDQVTTAVFQGFDITGQFVEQKVEIEFPGWVNFEKQILEERRIEREAKERREAEELEQARRTKEQAEEKARSQELWAKRVAEMRRFYFTPFLGFSLVSFDETFDAPLDYFAVTPQFSLQWVLAPPWLVLQASGFIQALPMGSTRSDVSVRFLGADLVLGIALPFGNSGLRLSLLLGGYYKTMLVSPEILGFRNLLGPELYPVLDFTLPRGHTLSVFGKYSPVVGGSGFLPLVSREWVFGASVTPLIAGKHQIPIQFEYSWIDLSLLNKTLVGRTLQLSVGYTF